MIPPFQVGLFMIGRPVALITMMAMMASATRIDAMMIHIMLNCFLGPFLYLQQSYHNPALKDFLST